MISRIVYAYVGILMVSLTFGFVAVNAHDESADLRNKVIYSLPSDIAQMLRERNHEGRGGCPGESSIFVYGFHYLDMRFDRTMWLLGAPDYLCETNSFISVIVNSNGEWTVGKASEADGLGSWMFEGAPILFQHSSDVGYFLTTENQVPAPGNFMYYSPDGVIWSSVNLPAPASKPTDYHCCSAPALSRLCIVEPGTVFISYDESEEFHASVWSTSVDESFPANVNWSPESKLPGRIGCVGIWPGDFVPRSLRKKTADGAVFDVSHDRAILIPGPTK